ncbi:hypothetical protein [Burkholderia sp. Ac-20379]|uniref:hypothetical protein n=1 Tax=Burkholderia sp. Ac-20379 TaxID=2703900 RepID=UPI00197F066D|nr:hypothetical protein [Burkholderia sp. Ac-20379]MBN3728605.1 hypothetical protein [Burkholderia sp. Ac-20379]
MDDTRNLMELAARVRAATKRRDIAALTILDRLVRDVANGMVSRSHASVTEQRAVALLRIAHHDAIDMLEAESARLARDLAALGMRRAGWHAYAQSGAGERAAWS